jgi:serine/threonine protein kinase
MQFADIGSLRNSLLNNFSNILWKDKNELLFTLSLDLVSLHHEFGYIHKDLHSGNILQYKFFGVTTMTFLSDFGLSGPANEQNIDNKVFGVLPYIAPEVLNGEPYTTSADIYSFGVVMAELSSGKPPFYNKRHDFNLAIAICNGLRPKFGKGTPEFYKKLAYRCMNANPNERPTANELYKIIDIWRYSTDCSPYHDSYYRGYEKFDHIKEELKAEFEKADREIPNISASFERDPDAIYISREITFNNSLTRPVNSSIITEYINNEESNGVFFYLTSYLFIYKSINFFFNSSRISNAPINYNSTNLRGITINIIFYLI